MSSIYVSDPVLVGGKYGYLTVTKRVGSRSYKCGASSPIWECSCECGKIKIATSAGLRLGQTKSCGCLKINYGRKEIKHDDYKSREHRIYNGMIARCYRDKNDSFKYYGGKGIVVCERWRINQNGQGYVNFLSDMGRAPTQKHSLDRIDSNGNYEPNNCRWATDIEQKNNQRQTIKYLINGHLFTNRDLANMFNMPTWWFHSHLRLRKQPIFYVIKQMHDNYPQSIDFYLNKYRNSVLPFPID